MQDQCIVPDRLQEQPRGAAEIATKKLDAMLNSLIVNNLLLPVTFLNKTPVVEVPRKFLLLVK